MFNVVVFLVSLGVRAIRAMCRRRADLVLENVALRQQVTALKKERPRPPLDDTERAFWVALRGSWPVWASRLLIVHADTVARWHRDRFRRYWAKISQRRHPGRPRIDAEIRRLVRTMAQDGWGAPRIHAELTKLGFIISEITVSRYLPRHPAEPDQLKRWMAFLRNHKDDIAAMDLFTVPTASLRLLYGFFVIEHGRRHIVHFNATFHPTSAWVIQQLREAFPYDTAPKYLIFDRDFIFSAAVIEFIKATGTKPVRTSFRSPWQNGTAERWVGSCRRELLEHVVVLGPCYLIRLVRAYIGPLPLGAEQGHTELESGHAPTVSYGESSRTAASRWIAPSIRVARGSLSQLGRSRYSAGRREVRPQHFPSRADHALQHVLEGSPGLESSPGQIMMMDRLAANT